MRGTTLALLALFTALAALGCSASGETDSDTDAAATQVARVDAEVTAPPANPDAAPVDARTLLSESMTFMSGLEGLSVDVAMSSAIKLDAGVRSAEADGKVMLSGANDAYLRVTNANDDAEVYSDGENQTVYFVNKGEYLTREAPGSRAEVVGAMSGGPMRQGSLWLGKFLHGGPELVEGLQEATYAGTVTPEGGPACHALELVYADYDATLWVEQGDTPLPMRLALDLTRAYAKAGAAQEVHVALDFSAWELNPTFEAGRFTFEIPSDATEMRMTAQEQARNPQLALIGEPAPAIDATLLGGAPFSLADHKDQDIVILEFWATWCGPCRMAMPAVAEVANAYADKGVVLYAVNIKEPEAKVQAFIDNMNYGHPVVLDPQGRAGAAYKASNIPQTVIVGKDGTVQAVHRGFSPYLRKQLSEELDTLLAGKSLVE